MTFNAEQRRVVEACGGRHLVLAPPGCGKTAVLAERIAWAHEHGVGFSDMACLTFTNRAARSMKERIMARLLHTGDSTESLFIGNVHRFCLHFLFDNGIVAAHTAVVDTDTSISIIADFMGDNELQVMADNGRRQQYSQVINMQHLMYQYIKGYPRDLIVHRDALPIDVLKEALRLLGKDYTRENVIAVYTNAEELLNDATITRDKKDIRLMLQQMYAAYAYERYKERNDLMDFEDLLLKTYDTLSAGTASRRYSWMQVDEVQDLNPLQMAIVDLFTTDDATVVYLGDAQQAIFSFMGAKTDTLTMLRQRCGEEHFHNFFHNYRSPQYMLDILNRYAQWQLGIDPALLPKTHDDTPRRPGDIALIEAPTNIDEANMVAREVRRLYTEHADETVAVIVAFNNDADEVSQALGQLPHFKISGTDFFSTMPVRLLLAHLGTLHAEHDFISWSHLLHGMKVYATCSAARQVVHGMVHLAMTPADVLQYDGSTYVAEFARTYEQSDIVVFDTETTGLDTLTDDVVQIAAVKVRRGKVIDSLNLFVETERTIPEMLGDVVNPLVEEYQQHPHLAHSEAMQRFVDFAKGCAILGHNATYDYQIMEHNMQRYAPQLSMQALWPEYLDSLKLAHLLHPRQPSYKLRDLLVQLHLEGHNTHLADDDIMATLSLVTHCYEAARSIIGRQMEFLSRHREALRRFRTAYRPLYSHAQDVLHSVGNGDTAIIAREIEYAYQYLLKQNCIPALPKLKYLLSYITTDLADSTADDSRSTLAQQLARHYSEICTMKEADLCGAHSMTERVVVSTVHKAKGLEFDNVIVYDAVDGKYPSVYATGNIRQGEEARKFYVALSRARRRLIISYCHNAISRYGSWYAKTITPYMGILNRCF